MWIFSPSLNFYSCSDETAIFLSIKWALKLSGQFRGEDVTLFSSDRLNAKGVGNNNGAREKKMDKKPEEREKERERNCWVKGGCPIFCQ